MTTVSNTIRTTVTLDTGSYGTKLTITTGGAIEPTYGGADAIVIPARLGHSRIVNKGTVTGAAGAYEGSTTSGGGGNGIDVFGISNINNSGLVAGGNGYSGQSGGRGVGTGGTGIYVAETAKITNSGTIAAGNGGVGGAGNGGAGGTGIDIAGVAHVLNMGAVLGGSGASGEGGSGGSAGNGIHANDGSTIVNAGFIMAGSGGGVNEGGVDGAVGGVGVDLSGSGTVSNTGEILGGQGGYTPGNAFNSGAEGGSGVELGFGCVFTNGGLVSGGVGGTSFIGGTGGDGANIISTRLTNFGTISGGAGGYADGVHNHYAPAILGLGGTGVDLSGTSTLQNNGNIEGGIGVNGGMGIASTGAATLVNTGSVAGGAGVDIGGYNGFPGGGGAGLLLNGGIVTNSGSISGGAGGNGGNGYRLSEAPGTGGIGAQIGSGALSNSGIISGGSGGIRTSVGAPPDYKGLNGAGGVGVNLTGGSIVTNTGSTTGGAGGSTSVHYTGGTGGAAVYLNGGTLITSGTISGGAAGTGGAANGVAGDAVQFGTLAGQLVIDPGAVVNGSVAANASVNDTLTLSGTEAGTLTGLGTQFTGFTTFSETSAANWTLGGVTTLGTGTQLNDSGKLRIISTLDDSGSATVLAAGDLQAVGGATLQIGTLTLKGGTLVDGAKAVIAIGATAAGRAGIISVEQSARIVGFGTLAGGAVADAGTIEANGGTLAINGSLAGAGSVLIDSSATLIDEGTLSVAQVSFAAKGGAHLLLAMPVPVAGAYPTFSGFGTGDIIDLKSLKISSLAFANGTLALTSGTTSVDALSFTGAYTTANFTLSKDGHGGTDVSYATNEVRGGETLSDFALLPGESESALSGQPENTGSLHDSAAISGEEVWGLFHPLPR